jgi:hypothetical protein
MQGAIHQGTLQLGDDAGQMGQGDVSPAAVANESDANRKSENYELSLESPETEPCSPVNGNEDTQSSSCVIINVDMENSCCDCGDGDGSSVLSSKTCSVEDVSLTGVQEEVKPVAPNEGSEEKVTSEARPDSVMEEAKQEPDAVGAVSVEAPKLRTDSSSVITEEEEGSSDLKQTESQDYINPRGVRFMSQEVGQDGEYAAFLFMSQEVGQDVEYAAFLFMSQEVGQDGEYAAFLVYSWR